MYIAFTATKYRKIKYYAFTAPAERRVSGGKAPSDSASREAFGSGTNDNRSDKPNKRAKVIQ